ncbi:MAG TPA: glutamine amidotransferase [Sandaracinaceae bacterium LLY-WYZ-13_1]|nr:glutamine amidotransferase [Sandaracinaceae bacterium LLY-WYZ-13_1]
MPGPVVIVKTGSTMPHLAVERGDYEDWIADGLGLPNVEVCRVEDGEALPDPATPRAVVVTGSSALVTDRLAWSERTRAWLPPLLERGTPLLAICYGHQLLADALGGAVGKNRHGREIGAIDVELTDEGMADPLFEGLPRTLRVSSSHRQSVRELPAEARRLAGNEAEPNQAFAAGERAWGVQFHPEWDHEVIRAYLEARVDILREEGFDPEAMLARVAPSPHGEAILKRFAALV